MVSVDSVAYGKWTVVPWNIIRYNIFGGSDRGPDLYGTSPWYFYILNLLLNFNILLVLALASLPSLAITYHVDRKRLGLTRPGPNESSPFMILALRLAPLYLWLLIFTVQPHKEERFMFPVYPLMCFNSAVTIYLLRGWLEVAYIHTTKSLYKVGHFHDWFIPCCLLETLPFQRPQSQSSLALPRFPSSWFLGYCPSPASSRCGTTITLPWLFLLASRLSNSHVCSMIPVSCQHYQLPWNKMTNHILILRFLSSLI